MMLDTILALAGFGLLLWLIFGFILPVLVVGKMIVDDPDFFEFPNLPDVKAMSEEGWELTYSAEDNDYFILGQVFFMKSRSKYRVILSDTSYAGGVSFDEECNSYEEAKEIADECANGYLEDN